MKSQIAKNLHLSHFVDTKYSGMAKGVGTQQIVGRIHLVKMFFGHLLFKNGFFILDDIPVDIAIGTFNLIKCSFVMPAITS